MELPGETVEQVNTAPASSRDPIKIPTELQNHHHSEPPETQLRRPTARDLEKKPEQDW